MIAVQNRTVHQRAAPVLHVRRFVFFYPQRAVKITRHHNNIFAKFDHRIDARAQRQTGNGDRNGDIAKMYPSPQQKRRHRRQQHHRDFHFKMRRQRDRRDHADQHRADGAADRDHEIERREIGRMGFSCGEFAVAEHAGDEEACEKKSDLPIEHEMHVLVGQHPRHRNDGGAEHRDEKCRLIPMCLPRSHVETENEGDEVQHQRHDP